MSSSSSSKKIEESQSDCRIVPIQDVQDARTLKGIPWCPWEAMLQNGKEMYRAFVLYKDNHPVGYVSYGQRYEAVPRAEINALGVKEDYQGQGLGSLLMRYVMCVITNDKKYKGIDIIAKSTRLKQGQGIESLIKFYEKHGFECSDLDRTPTQARLCIALRSMQG